MGSGIDGEFDRQLGILLKHGYPELVGLPEGEFVGLVESSRPVLHSTLAGADTADAVGVPFVLVVSGALVRAEDLVPTLRLQGGTAPGVVDRNHGEQGLAQYASLPELGVPDTAVYAMVDVRRGEEFCGVRPTEAVEVIVGRNRTPLTIHEGIALVTQFPALLEKNRCFMLAGSRRGDKRVPAMWISGKAPKLGWCWEGNPHTWLGTASAGTRV